jgi:hypothetical protein
MSIITNFKTTLGGGSVVDIGTLFQPINAITQLYSGQIGSSTTLDSNTWYTMTYSSRSSNPAITITVSNTGYYLLIVTNLINDANLGNVGSIITSTNMDTTWNPPPSNYNAANVVIGNISMDSSVVSYGVSATYSGCVYLTAGTSYYSYVMFSAVPSTFTTPMGTGYVYQTINGMYMGQ